jgi:hypothetical protein
LLVEPNAIAVACSPRLRYNPSPGVYRFVQCPHLVV